MEIINKLHSYFLGNYASSINVPSALEEVRTSLSSDQKLKLEILTVQAFRTELLSLILKQNEDLAIQYVLQVAVVLEDRSPQIKEEFFDFSAPLPQESIAFRRSISHISNLLKLNNLNYTMNYLSKN